MPRPALAAAPGAPAKLAPMAGKQARPAARAGRNARYWWSRLADDELLDLRLCDLGLRIEGSPVEKPLARLYRELERRGIRSIPHCWITQEWFSPDGVPGIAIPFHLVHPRLKRLERRFMGEVEGGNVSET